MPLFDPDPQFKQEPQVKDLPSWQLANGMVIRENDFAQFELLSDGKVLGTFTHPEGVWKLYRELAFTEADAIALHGLGVSLGTKLPEAKPEKLPWEIHAII